MADDKTPANRTIEVSLVENVNAFFEAKAQGFRALADEHPCYAFVGRIAAEQARIEYFLDAIIADLAGVDSATGACLTGQMVGLYPRYFALYQLAHHRELPTTLRKEVEDLQNKANEIGNIRNRVIHDPWFEESREGGSYQHKSKTRKDRSFGPEPVTVDDLQRSLAKLQSHRERVWKLREAIWAEQQAAPKKKIN